MSSEEPPPSSLPPSMGPGARPMQAGAQRSPGASLKEVMDIRKSYSVSIADNRLNLSYELDKQPRTYSIPFDSMPISGLSRTICFGQKTSIVTGVFIIDTIRGAENMVGQQLTQTEAEGFAKHGTKRIQYGVWGNLIALTGAYGLAYTGKDKMKFPFMKPKDLERYNNFPNRYIPILRGSWARIMWHITRANIYAGIGLLAAGPLFSSMGDVSMMVGLYQDSRTQNILKKMKEKGGFDRINSNRSRPGQSKAQPQTQSQDLDSSPQEDYQSSSYGDASAYSGDSSFTDSSTDSGLMSDSSASSRQFQQSQQASPSQRRPQPTRQSLPQSPSPSASPDFFFDDASPTAGNDPNQSTPNPYQHQGSGSAWSRVRKGNSDTDQADYTGRYTREQNLQSASDRTSGRSMGSTGYDRSTPREISQSANDSFSFSGNDEEKAVAKQQAQKEFDAMLDRERRESGSGDYSRGMQAIESGSEDPGSGGGGGGSAWDRPRGGRG